LPSGLSARVASTQGVVNLTGMRACEGRCCMPMHVDKGRGSIQVRAFPAHACEAAARGRLVRLV